MLKWFADRLAYTGKRVGREEKGFTLIELLVVVIIIGILAAIAIPTFLAQRERAQDSSVQSDLRNAASAAQACAAAATPAGSYSNCYTAAELQPFGFNTSSGVVYTPGTANANYFEASAKYGSGGTVYSVTTDTADSDAGRVVQGPLD